MAMNNKGKRNKSLCEKSMKMVTNIVKLSSFSIAKVSLGTSEPSSPATKNLNLSQALSKFPMALPCLISPGVRGQKSPKAAQRPSLT
ncbi:Homeobox-leucine zipper protein [Actinidia chinensis var. chinensis]|uniref:Homeobox-leucine zipper protein n=1 Tax=Actinidia chinensis var. chinensis TaxID=1590841 RepID=A0A2R6QGT5_ACTCC|nr:Homeobox-leucine zipper protein [Actinidia chinensis var. chinensis]